MIEYDTSPYTPKDIRATLANKDKNSAPGYDGIVYEYLLNMPFLHQTLATVFTRIRDEGVAPDSWAKSRIFLIKKDPEAQDNNPSNFCMISLTLNIGKLYHTLEASRTLSFMLQNNYLDPSAQKAYVNGINGCVEHVTVVNEAIQHAKLNNKTLHATWLDLKDAFGSVPHVLIPYVMSYYHIPQQIITYITSLYSKLEGKVCTKEWESEFFKFLRGVFQGDPFSGIIFLVVFNPVVEYLKKHKETHGYQISTKETGVKSVVTTPFAEDFNILTRSKTMQQNLISDIEEKLESMGLVVKPEKCRSLSIIKGNVSNEKFILRCEKTGKNTEIDSVIDKPMKFLGSVVGAVNTPSAMLVEILSKLKKETRKHRQKHPERRVQTEYLLKICITFNAILPVSPPNARK